MKVQKLYPLLVVAAGLLAYHNSFTGGFIIDDVGSILENPSIRRLWPIWQPLSPPHRHGLTVEGRPLINLSLAINYALGGYNVWGYHALNLLIHILAGLTLFGIVRRTLLQPAPIRSGPALRDRFGAVADELALATALLWTVHPLQTESVTYIIQRAESMMGLFYLLTLYCLIRGVESQRARLWYGLCVTACALGMTSKEVMASAPLMVLLYDRAFLSDSFRESWRRRWPLYLGLAATWILLAVVLVSGQLPATTMNAARLGLSWREYLASEPAVILHYLRLSVWPHPLGYGYYRSAGTWMSILPPAVVVITFLAMSVWAWRTKPLWGFVGAWCFLILAPTSSVIPLDSPAYEHRMYLPLAALVVAAVLGIRALVGRRSTTAVFVLAIGLGFLTWRRNQDYRSETIMRFSAVAKFPKSALAHYNLGVTLWKNGRRQEAIEQYEQALSLKPDHALAHNNLGLALQKTGRLRDAISHYKQALRLEPGYVEALNNLGVALAEMGAEREALEHYERALQLRPDSALLRYNYGNTLFRAGRIDQAIGQYEMAVRINPDFVHAHYNWGIALEQAGQPKEAIAHYEQALRLKPDFAEAQKALARLRAP
jgi:Tfp pilus assembly protein PilF